MRIAPTTAVPRQTGPKGALGEYKRRLAEVGFLYDAPFLSAHDSSR